MVGRWRQTGPRREIVLVSQCDEEETSEKSGAAGGRGNASETTVHWGAATKQALLIFQN